MAIIVGAGCETIAWEVNGPLLKEEMAIKSRGHISLYYESLYGLRTLNPFGVHFVFKAEVHRSSTSGHDARGIFESGCLGYLTDQGS